jgi:arabinogalactan endo-1,4-beta-galactosidase
MKFVLRLVIVALALPGPLLKAELPSSFALGVDVSLLKFIEDHGVEYRDAGAARDGLEIFKDHGCNYVRLRLFVNPDGTKGQVNSLSYTIELAERVKAAGLGFLLDLHYSDGWADPGHQIIPAAWKGETHAQLVDTVFNYTRETLAAFKQVGCLPDMVEVGNEITNGMIWPDGGPISEAKWNDFTDLLKAGIRGVHADGNESIKIMIHIDRGGDKNVSKWFFDHLAAHEVRFDVIGLSFYPFWGGRLSDLQDNLAFLAKTYDKDVMVAETAYNWRNAEQKELPETITPGGQKAFLADLIRMVAATPGGHGKGVFYWAPEWIEVQKWPAIGGGWEDRAMFDDQGNVLPVLDAFGEAGKEGSR